MRAIVKAMEKSIMSYGESYCESYGKANHELW